MDMIDAQISNLSWLASNAGANRRVAPTAEQTVTSNWKPPIPPENNFDLILLSDDI